MNTAPTFIDHTESYLPNNYTQLVEIATQYGTPTYIFDEQILKQNCQRVLAMPNAFGLTVRYAMKANANRALLQLITSTGVQIDASSLNEVKRAIAAGIPKHKIQLTTQENAIGKKRQELEELILGGLSYNVCSLSQYEHLRVFAKKNKEHITLAVRVHPEKGTGESTTRNTGGKYSCFGVHQENLPELLQKAKQDGISFHTVHTHVGSGGDPEVWRANIDDQLAIVENHFPEAKCVSFGGGFKVARMPYEKDADINALGAYAKQKIQDFKERTGRALHMEVEPGTFIAAKAGNVLTQVIDRKKTGEDGIDFILVDGSMEVNARPLLYGSKHPFIILKKDGSLISDEFNLDSSQTKDLNERAIVGRCCETGDAQTISETGEIAPRLMGNPKIGDYVLVGACGAYSSELSANNYNSHVAPAMVLLQEDGKVQLIRKEQKLEALYANEIDLGDQLTQQEKGAN